MAFMHFIDFISDRSFWVTKMPIFVLTIGGVCFMIQYYMSKQRRAYLTLLCVKLF